ncbi:MAG: sulfatase [Verrucomicrobiota bacterium]
MNRTPVSLALALALLLAPSGIAQDSKPNILFLAIDDLNDWVGPLAGHPQVLTPHMDKLAKRGTTFLNAHCQAPLCNSSRTSLLTGLRPTTTGVYSLQPWFRTVPGLEDHVTLPQYLKANGYATYSGGKIYHGGYGRKKEDVEFDQLGPGASGKPFPPKKIVNTPQAHRLVDWGPFPHNDQDKGDWLVADWAVQTLDSKPEGPFFLACGFFLPHVPCFATEKWFDLYPTQTTLLPPILEGDRDDTPRFSWYTHWKLPEPRLKFLEENGETLNLTRSYLACISFVDSQVGRVLDALDRNGFGDNTVIVLWSDHGWHLGEKQITGKNTLWDRGTRVPLIFAGPGVVKAAKSTQPAELLDIYPTLVELCGLPENPENEGLSLVAQLKDPAKKRIRPAITTQSAGNHGIRTENWRYIHYADGSEELYDMVQDPHEWTNLADDPDYASVKKILATWLPKNEAKPAPGSKSRLLELREDGKVFWELEEIRPNDPIPEI